jgi:hypothetical protein
MDSQTVLNPTVGMLATVRNRRGLVSAVEPFDGPDGRLHLTTVEYLDVEGESEENLVWEREPGARLLEPAALPSLERAPMLPADADALVRATRWTALSPYLDPDGADGPLTRMPVSSPFHGAIQVEDFQLVPLLKALRMPRIALMIADDVGLGKTIEAGLVLSELLLRRRIRRVLILSPASLRVQWQQEMDEKFSLSFDVVDRDQTHQLRKNLGLDANPWRTYPRIITSYHYLKQPDVLESFLAACRMPDGSTHLPWDLLIVDEVHNLSPAPFGADSELTKMLRLLTPHFEHRIFLSATPHNGHTRSFTGLLELLDPVRFTQTSEISPAERLRVEDVLVRRLKSEINQRSNPPRFCERLLTAVPLSLHPSEQALSVAFQAFRGKVRSLVAQSVRREQLAGAFAVEILGKRLLSCPYAFADSWRRYRQGLELEEAADADEVQAAGRSAEEETGDDREAESRRGHAVQIVGAWLRPLAAQLLSESEAVERALEAIGLERDGTMPLVDARFEALCALIDKHLRPGGAWSDTERLVIFTEYKTTLDYLVSRLNQRYKEPGRLVTLFGGMDDDQRSAVKLAFNDPASAVRILIGTDAAAEGLNLQATARYLLHFDVPWNPSRLEQRNGRLDRHGQSRDVGVFHFDTQDDADLKFLGVVVRKVNSIRSDLGSAGEVFDTAFQRRFIQNESVANVEIDLDSALALVHDRTEILRSAAKAPISEEGEAKRLEALAAELDLTPQTLSETLETALAASGARPRFDIDTSDPRRVRLRHPIPSDWNALIDTCLRRGGTAKAPGALPALVFDPAYYLETINGRPIFRTVKDTALLHLAHPLYHRALATFARLRFPGGGSEEKATRWTVRRGGVPPGCDALILLTVEEVAVNELRERFHHWVHTLRLPIKSGELAEALPHQAARVLYPASLTYDARDAERARELWDEVDTDVRALLRESGKLLTERLTRALQDDGKAATREEQERFQSRQGELSTMIQQQTLQRLEREIAEMNTMMASLKAQPTLFGEDERVGQMAKTQAEKEEELRRRKERYEELRALLARERKRIVEGVLPKRFALRGEARVFPVTVEIRLPEGGR